MRKLDRVASRCLGLAVAAVTVLACTSTPDEPPGADPTEDGGTADVTPPPPPPGTDGGTGADGGPIDPPKACTKGADCASGVCNEKTGLCEAATCKDGVKNGAESDVDCGGTCNKCDVDKKCALAADCASGVCKDEGNGMRCIAPTSTDGVKNGAESDVDCGGAGNPTCADGKMCAGRDDCASTYCKAGICTAVSPADGVQNGDETDVDCGGAGAARCVDDKMCLVDTDCESDVCKDVGAGLRCQAPSPTDGKKNGTETDVDCGGAGNPGCATGKTCAVNTDCASLGCNYNLKCAAGRSCTARYGGDTCGMGGAGGVGPEQWEDCCAKAPVTPTANPGAGVEVMLDKYQVTAGRMRVFMESIGYDVRGFVQAARAAGQIPAIPGDPAHLVLEPAWDLYLPVSFAGNTDAGEIAERDQGSAVVQPGIYTSVRNHLGGLIFFGNAQSSTGCYVGAPGTHAFRFPNGQQDGAAPDQSQDVYDTKSMQCIDYLVAQAFCVWDGGRLATTQEWLAAWGPAAMPWAAETTRTPRTVTDNSYWGCRFPWATDADQANCGVPWNAAVETIEYADYRYSYEYPKLKNNDYIVFISAPGRTRGRGPAGHADIIGNNYSITSNVTYNADPKAARHGWNGSGSWEVHGYTKGQSRTSMLLNKYGKLGLRCAYP